MKKRHLPNVVTLLILTAITVFLWIGLDVYRALSTKPEPVVPPEISAPLNPNLDATALSELSTRIHFEDSEIATLVPVTTPTPVPTPVPTIVPQATPLASPTSTP